MNGTLTRAELAQGFNDNTVIRKLDGITQGLCDGFYAQNSALQTGFCGLSKEIAENNAYAQYINKNLLPFGLHIRIIKQVYTKIY